MTREDKRAYNYARDRLANDDYPVYNDEYELELAYKAGIEDAKNHPHWISVEEELPPEEDRQFSITVLAYAIFNEDLKDALRDFNINDDGGVERGFYDYYHNKWFLTGGMEGKTITHWMSLPESPVVSNLEKIGKDLKGGEE